MHTLAQRISSTARCSERSWYSGLVDGEAIPDSTRILQRIEAISGAFTRELDERTGAEAWLWEDFADTALNGFWSPPAGPTTKQSLTRVALQLRAARSMPSGTCSDLAPSRLPRCSR